MLSNWYLSSKKKKLYKVINKNKKHFTEKSGFSLGKNDKTVTERVHEEDFGDRLCFMS